MIAITENEELIIKNTFIYRGLLTGEESQRITKEMSYIISSKNIAATTEFYVANFGAVKDDEVEKLDSIIIVGVEETFKVDNRFYFQEIFKLSDAIKMHCECRLSEVNLNVKKLNEYILSNGFKTTTSTYITSKGGQEYGTIVIDMYVGVEK